MDNTSSAVGIIFKINNSKQVDKVINIFTSDGEKLSLLAKGVRSHTSKRAQSIEIGNLVKTKFVAGYNVPILTDIKVINDFREWKKEFKSMIYLQLVFEILNYFSFESNPEPDLYNLLQETLETDVSKIEYLITIFTLKLLENTGNLPELDRDVNTNEVISSSDAILNSNGVGYVKDESNAGYVADERIYKTQRYILQNDFRNCLRINLDESEVRKMLNIHLNWIESVIDRQIKSREVIREMGV